MPIRTTGFHLLVGAIRCPVISKTPTAGEGIEIYNTGRQPETVLHLQLPTSIQDRRPVSCHIARVLYTPDSLGLKTTYCFISKITPIQPRSQLQPSE